VKTVVVEVVGSVDDLVVGVVADETMTSTVGVGVVDLLSSLGGLVFLVGSVFLVLGG